MPIRRPTLVLASLLFALEAHAQGRAVLEISGANFKPMPLAVAPMQGLVEHVEPLDATLKADLQVSGLFELLNPKSFLADRSEGINLVGIDFSKWSAVGADGLVKAKVDADDRTLKVELRLFDVGTRKEAVKASFTGRKPDLRAFAHDFANKVYRYYTNEPGIFQTRLAFARRANGQKEVWACDFDGQNALPLTNGGDLNLLPAWAPDGRRLVITSYRDGAPMLYTLDAATKALRALVPGRGELQTGGAFSPDGKRIAFTMSEGGVSNIYVVNADGSGLKNLTESRHVESSPAWSPDGKRIAFVSKRSGDPQLFVMNADGSGVERLTFQGKYNQTPDWSPRGDVIAFTARDERNVFDLFTVDVRTKTIKRLTQDQGNNEEPSFSPNGRHIVFTSTRDRRPRLYLMNADGTNQRPLPVDDATTPAWGPFAAE